jgi:hypothetical protein
LRRSALEAEKTSITLAEAESSRAVVSIHPAAIKNYLADVATMRQALDDEQAAERPELIAPLRRLIDSVVVHAEPGVRTLKDNPLPESEQIRILYIEVKRERYMQSPTPSGPLFSNTYRDEKRP